MEHVGPAPAHGLKRAPPPERTISRTRAVGIGTAPITGENRSTSPAAARSRPNQAARRRWVGTRVVPSGRTGFDPNDVTRSDRDPGVEDGYELGKSHQDHRRV